MRAAKFSAVLVLAFGAFGAVASAEYAPAIPVAPLPAGAVAVVDSTPITKQAFDHEYEVQSKFAGKQTAKERAAARGTLLTSLIKNVRMRIEANSIGIVISDAAVTDRFEVLKEQSFPTDRDYKKFLSEYGQTEAELIEMVRVAMYEERLRDAWSATATVTDQELLDEYKAHPLRYSYPEARDLALIFAERRATIYRALRALKRGRNFKRVAKRYSSDSVSAKLGGRFPGVTKGQFPRKLDRAVFSAKRGKLVGPIKTQYGYYIFRVTRIHEPRLRSFEKSRKIIRESLLERKRTALVKLAQASFEQRWKPATLCRTGYVAKACGSYAD
ncbi:MAG: peptidyl-prolyl cis-trans isomerase [Thermoleophilaceae bacterium]|nr:peptidyl-prolyl cis-trans isomerase [Thermoleophilaceae bacterium]